MKNGTNSPLGVGGIAHIFKLGRKYNENPSIPVFQSKYFIFECKNFDISENNHTFELFLIYIILNI